MSRLRKALVIAGLLLLVPMFFEGYTYRYELESRGFMSFSEMGFGVACPGIFRAYYQINDEWKVKFVRSYFPGENDSGKFNDPNAVISEFERKARSMRLIKGDDYSVLVLSRDENGSFLSTHYRLKAVYEQETLRKVSFNITHSLNYSPGNRSVLVDYVDIYKTYDVEETRCWQALIGWFKPLLKRYLRSRIGNVPYPNPWDDEPW